MISAIRVTGIANPAAANGLYTVADLVAFYPRTALAQSADFLMDDSKLYINGNYAIFRYNDASWWLLVDIREDPFVYYFAMDGSLTPIGTWQTNAGAGTMVAALAQQTATRGMNDLIANYDALTVSDSTKAVGHIQTLVPEEGDLTPHEYRKGL